MALFRVHFLVALLLCGCSPPDRVDPAAVQTSESPRSGISVEEKEAWLAIFEGVPLEPEEEYEVDPPEGAQPTFDCTIEMAWTVWNQGPGGVKRRLGHSNEEYWWQWQNLTEFHGVDWPTAGFLERPSLLSAVQFSCARGNSPEDRFTEALDHEDAKVRLQALTCLMKVRAPRSIDQQFRVLQELAVAGIEESGAELVRVLGLEFSSERIHWLFEQNLPGVQGSNEAHLHWAIRAAGILQDPTHFARVAEWALSDNLDLNLAAERALEDYDGPEADRALLACVQAWRYDSSLRAASALMDRNPEALRRLLSTLDVRSRRRYWKGILLGRLQDPAAVPILIAEVGGVAIKDREMFDCIEALAGPEHRELIEALPHKVRPNQMERAVEVRRVFRARYGFPD